MRKTHLEPDATEVIAVFETPRAARLLASVLAVAALIATVALVIAGESLPPAGAFLLLAVLIGISVNRVAFFPSELSATAEAAVMFAAVIGFRHESPLLGPLMVALLVGPLDLLHWEQRSFVRMAYNTGSQGLAALCGAAAFAALEPTIGGSMPALLGAATVASLPYLVVDSVLGYVLLRVRGVQAAPAARSQLDVNGLVVAFAIAGAGVAIFAGPLGWWAVVPTLVGMTFVPEFLLVRGRRSGYGGIVRAIGVGSLAAAVVTALGVASDRVDVAALFALAVLAGAEVRLDGPGKSPAILASVVATVPVVVHGRVSYLVAVVTALLAIAVSAGVEARGYHLRRVATSGAIVTVAAIACVAANRFVPWSRGPLVGAVGAAILGAAAFAVTASVVGSARGRDVAWLVPFLGVAVVLSVVWRWQGSTGSLSFAGGLVLVVITAAQWGSPPWPSRMVARVPLRRGHGATLSVLAASSVAAATTWVLWPAPVPEALVFVSAVGAGATVALTTVGVRQWCFHPRRRCARVLLLDSCAAGAVAACTTGGLMSLALVCVVTTTMCVVARPLLRLVGGLADPGLGELMFELGGREPVVQDGVDQAGAHPGECLDQRAAHSGEDRSDQEA